MANHGVGTRYVSVNLNKSYGQQPHHHYNHSGGYGTNRGRLGGHGGGGGGGGMVVLSRPRSSQKTGPKLSVPPPLNLPSLRKEHERIDSLGAVHSSGGISTSGSRPSSSGMGWTKPAASAALQEKERLGGDNISDAVEGVNKGSNGLYMPRSGAAEPLDGSFPPVEKAAILWGEDFPSLKATLPAASGTGQKQREGLKQKQAASEDLSKDLRDVSRTSSPLLGMRPRSQSVHNQVDSEPSRSPSFLNGLRSSEQVRKQEHFPGPLPLVRLNPRSDWADDERDTSHGLRVRERDHGYSTSEPSWDRDFDFPRHSLLPHKPATHNLFDRTGQHETEPGKSFSGKVRPSSGGQEVNTRRVSSPLQNEVANGRNIGGARPSSRGREVVKESKSILSPLRETIWDTSGIREAPYQHGGRQPWNKMDTSIHRGTFIREGYGFEQQNRDKRPCSKNDKPHLEDSFVKDLGDTDFDVSDPFPVLGVVKKKKEALKQTDFHDPVRESFEAELERVQKMQEEERRRIMEEQERAMELARREEEERLQLAREQEEQQKRLEEQAREAAWRTELERLEAVRRAEELRKAKEEEKRRILMEEERRKQAANQKLQELEEKIAKRQAEAAKGCSSSSTISGEKGLDVVKEKELPRAADVVDWENGEKMVEIITSSSLLDRPVPNRSFEINSASHFSRDGSSGFPVRDMPSSWRKETFENGSNSTFLSQNMENVSHSSQSDAGRVFHKKEFLGTAGYMTARSCFKPGFPDPSIDHRWNIPGDGDHYARNGGMGSEFREGFGEQFGDPGWGQGQGHLHRNPYSSYPEKLYQNPEGDDYYPFGRPRYLVRQPRVLPPPSLASMQKPSLNVEVDRPGPSTFIENGMKYSYVGRIQPNVQAGYGVGLQDDHGQPGNNRNEQHQFDREPAARCDSQSSLSVSSPPDSPVHLSHDDLEESGDSSVLAGARKGKDTLSGKVEEHVISVDAADDSLMIATSSVSCGDDEEWTLDNNEHLQEQEEYDEVEDGYRDEDEMHGGDEENTNLVPGFEGMHLQEKDSNLVLGFNEGVEVEMPSDDFEKCSRNGEAAFTIPLDTVDSMKGRGPSSETGSCGQAIQLVEIPNQLKIDNSSTVFLDTDTAMQKLTIQPNSPQQLSQLSELEDKMDSLGISAISTQPVPPSLNVALHSSTVQPTMPSASSAPIQTEEPVKLQFGLFSGPSLIPSPVPAIQIGSIQMPLPFHPQVGSSLTHGQQSQPHVFQFGHLCYAPSISHGVLPLPPHSTVQLDASSTFALKQNPGSSMTLQHGQGTNTFVRSASLPLSEPRSSIFMRPLGTSNGNMLKSVNAFPAGVSSEAVMSQPKETELSGKSELHSREEICGRSNSVDIQSEGQVQAGMTTHLVASKDKNTSGLKTHGQTYGSRGKRDALTVKNYGSQLSSIPEVSRADSGGYRGYRRQRVEFRVRASNGPSLEENPDADRRGLRNSMKSRARRFVLSNKSTKHDSDGLLKTDSGSRSEIGVEKETAVESHVLANSGQTNLKRNLIAEEDIDAPLQSGTVRVFEQPGVEAPIDDNDFIEVRSKRQMLNDRREQREKEIKAKSQATKVSRKSRSSSQQTVVVRSNKIPSVSGATSNKQSNPVTSKQPLAPIGTPAHKADGQAGARSRTIKSVQTSAALPVVSRSEQNPAASFIFNNKNKVLDNIPTSLGSWSNPRIDLPVMALTQSQLDEAMKPVSFDSCISIGNHADSINEPNTASTSILPKSNTFPTDTSPTNSFLGGGQIQFGAVTSSTVLPPCGRTENDNLFFEKDKRLNASPAHMETCEAEAEAAASAVAVAAITSDEINAPPVSVSGSVSVSVSVVKTKIYGGPELDGIAGTGIGGEQSSHSKAEEPLSVSLPADLSVDTPISLWPPLLSPHNSSSQVISHFPPAPHHFPFYDMHPMLRAPIFAFGPHEESGSNQTQSQVGGTASCPPMTWQQGHSGVDSFYAPPAGFAGPFLSPPGGIPSVQGPPHMFVYNHFAPVGQFGQVGLSFMGTAYIPSGKQPDWKHNPVSTASVGGDGDSNNSSVASLERNPAILPASVRHLSPGSALLPLPSPLAMFDVSPFQEIPVQARWPHIPAPHLQPTPPSMPLQEQQQPEGPNLPLQYRNIPPPNQPAAANMFPHVQTSAVSDSPIELGLADTSNTYSSSIAPQTIVPKVTSFPSIMTDANRLGNNQKPSQQQSSQQRNMSSQQYSGSAGHSNNHSRGGSQRGSNNNGSGSEWARHYHHHQHHRRSSFHGRSQSMNGEKGFTNTKLKQIYVAKQNTTIASASDTNKTNAVN